MTAERDLIAIVTGASRGIGSEIARRLSKSGIIVALLSRDLGALRAVESKIQSAGRRAFAVQCDVTDKDSVTSALAQVRATLGSPCVLINNAGFGGPFHRTTEVSDAEWDRVFATNVRSVFWFCRELLPGMADSGFGRIVNICSIQGLMGASLSSTYSASKHALVGYTKSVAIEWGSSGVTCNALCPGYIGTPMTGSGIAHPEEAIDVHRIPARRLGSTIEIAELVAFLIGRDASYINGSTFVIDGGILAGMDTIMPAG